MTTNICCTINIKQCSNNLCPHKILSQIQFLPVPSNMETEVGGYSDKSNEIKCNVKNKFLDSQLWNRTMMWYPIQANFPWRSVWDPPLNL